MTDHPFIHFGHRRWVKSHPSGMIQSECSCGWQGNWLWSNGLTQWVDHFELEDLDVC